MPFTLLFNPAMCSLFRFRESEVLKVKVKSKTQNPKQTQFKIKNYLPKQKYNYLHLSSLTAL
jgi:hypothetical protein